MNTYKTILIYGFALFAMFFGSGNLVFPLQIGQASGVYWQLGFLGLLLTGIALPFLGLFVIKLHKGNFETFFAEAGPAAKLLLPLFTLSLLGAFGVVPRCITVAHGGMSYVTPELPLGLFSAGFSLVTYYFCLKDERMISALGKWMSPILLLSLAGLIATGVWTAKTSPDQTLTSMEAFSGGFLTGYQTMDLFAAFFFSALMFSQIQKGMLATASHKETIRFAIKPSLIGAGLLAIVYLGFVYLGAHYSTITSDVDPEYILPTIAQHIMGNQATLFIGVAMLFSCLTTAVALNNIYARYLCGLFGLEQTAFPKILLATTLVSFGVSLLDFKGIAAFLAPALEVSYPGLIWLTILGIITPNWQSFKKLSFYGITGYMVVMMLI